LPEDSLEFEELLAYSEEGVIELWSAPTKRKEIPSSHFFDPKNKKYPYRNPDGSVNCGGVMAAWKMANGARSGKKADSSIISKIKSYRDRCSKKESKEKKQSEIHYNLSFPISLPETIDLATTKPIDIQILKKGKFRHPWYGVLNFNESFFDIMIRNFEADIPQERIAFDFNHQPDWGAAAWVENLSKQDDSLMASVSLTEKGKESIKKKEFLYFSSSYTDDYVEYVFEDEADDKGNVVTKEYKINHGPTLMGGGLTNRPFIKGMAPVSLSEDGTQTALEEIVENLDIDNKLKEVDEEMEKKLKELEDQKKELEDKIKGLETVKDADKGESKKEIENINKQLQDVLKAISDASEEKKLQEKDGDKKLKEADEKIINLEASNKDLNDKVTGLTSAVNKLLEDKKVMATDKFKAEMKNSIREFKDLGVFPATLKIVEEVLLSDEVKDFEITLREGEGDKKVETKKNLAIILKDLFMSIPEDHRFSEKETSESIISTTGGTKEMSVEEVQKYADDNKLSYSDALIALDKEGKL